MKPNKVNAEITSTLTGEDVEMTLAANELHHIMGLLTDLYSNRVLAVIREYSTNAWDSHVEAGVTRPIEVTVPTALEPAFKVQDFGVGMNAEDIREVYSQYGASTKRETNDLNGILGIGGKAALTLTSQFTVVGIKDGIRTTVSVSRNEKGGGTMKILSKVKTDDPNGVTVIVPFSDSDRRRAEIEIQNFFRFWKPGTVLVDGQEPELLVNSGVEITDGVRAYKELDSNYLVMGNVAYQVSYSYDAIPYRVSIVAEVPLGSLDFAPSREGLQDTKLTKETVEKVKLAYKDNWATTIQREVDEAETKMDALARIVDFSFIGIPDNCTWRGKDLPRYVQYEADDTLKHDPSVYMQKVSRVWLDINGKRRNVGGTEQMRSCSLLDCADSLWITGFDNVKWSAATRNKLDAYLEHLKSEGQIPKDTKSDGAMVVRRDTPPDTEWIDPQKVIRYEDLREWRIPRDSSAYTKPKVKGTYDLLIGDEDGRHRHEMYPADKIDPNIVLMFSSGERPDHEQALEQYGKYQIAIVPQYRQAKFLRIFPQAIPVGKVKETLAKHWWKELSPTDKRALRWDGTGDDFFEWFRANTRKVKDPDIKDLVKIVKKSHTQEPSLRRKYDNLHRYLDPKEISFEKLDERYPLICCGAHDSKSQNHAVHYVNAIYEKEVKG